jgi:uncharacterized protein
MSTKNDSIQLKMSKSRALLAEVEVLMQHKFYITAVNRLYYSCFHATKSLLLTKDFVPKTHSGVVNMLHRHFVQNGSFDFSHASFFSRLMQERIEDDYSDSMIVTAAEVQDFIPPAHEYVAYIGKLIDQYLHQ